MVKSDTDYINAITIVTSDINAVTQDKLTKANSDILALKSDFNSDAALPSGTDSDYIKALRSDTDSDLNTLQAAVTVKSDLLRINLNLLNNVSFDESEMHTISGEIENDTELNTNAEINMALTRDLNNVNATITAESNIKANDLSGTETETTTTTNIQQNDIAGTENATMSTTGNIQPNTAGMASSNAVLASPECVDANNNLLYPGFPVFNTTLGMCCVESTSLVDNCRHG